jgi:hypothetical protein
MHTLWKYLWRRFDSPRYATTIAGLMIRGVPAPYPVVNERAVRAGAGLMFVAGFFSFMQAFYLQNYDFIQFFVVVFLFDFTLKVFAGPRWSPVSRLAQWIVRRQTPEYVGAIQKRFAWSIGFMLASTMTILLFLFGVVGPVNLIICAVCLTFMFMESAFGICAGCTLYQWLQRWGVIPVPAVQPVCPGNVCAVE